MCETRLEVKIRGQNLNAFSDFYRHNGLVGVTQRWSAANAQRMDSCLTSVLCAGALPDIETRYFRVLTRTLSKVMEVSNLAMVCRGEQ